MKTTTLVRTADEADESTLFLVSWCRPRWFFSLVAVCLVVLTFAVSSAFILSAQNGRYIARPGEYPRVLDTRTGRQCGPGNCFDGARLSSHDIARLQGSVNGPSRTLQASLREARSRRRDG